MRNVLYSLMLVATVCLNAPAWADNIVINGGTMINSPGLTY